MAIVKIIAVGFVCIGLNSYLKKTIDILDFGLEHETEYHDDHVKLIGSVFQVDFYS